MLLLLNLEFCCAWDTGTAQYKGSEKEGLLVEMRTSNRGSFVKSVGNALYTWELFGANWNKCFCYKS
jgi:hypothetical protein